MARARSSRHTGATRARLPMHPRGAHVAPPSPRPNPVARRGGVAGGCAPPCALAACLEERDILRGGTRQHDLTCGCGFRTIQKAGEAPSADATGAWHQARRNMGEIKRMARRRVGRPRKNQPRCGARAAMRDDESDTDGAGEAADDDIMAFSSARQVDLDSLIAQFRRRGARAACPSSRR